jgi:prepilin-type N-terminal cleavage/methylation domain-containing protein
MKAILSRKQQGFTLVELAVVVVILGVLAAFGVPRFMSSVERSKASEAFTYLSSIQTAQERYQARQGRYANNLKYLDIDVEKPEYFKVSGFSVPSGSKNLETGWQMKLTRTGSAAGYGAYTVVYTHKGYQGKLSNIKDEINPRQTKN